MSTGQNGTYPERFSTLVSEGISLTGFFSSAWEQAGEWYVEPKSGFAVPLYPTDTTWLAALNSIFELTLPQLFSKWFLSSY